MFDWKQCEGELAGGEFPLERYLGGGDGGAVFLTTFASGRAAIKVVPADPALGEELVARWNRAAALEHPHLIRIFAAGTWTVAGAPLAYFVMEFADENLAEVLGKRPLTPDEAREMLPPVADALAYLHGRGLAHGDLKPSNILAVDDALKISSETASAGDPTADIGALGATLVQALTQQAPAAQGGSNPAVDGLPFPFRELAQTCLRDDPRLRWSAAKIGAYLRAPAQPASTLPAPTPPSTERAAAGKPRPRYYVAAGVLALVAVAVGGGLLMRRTDAPAPSPAEPVRPVSSPAPPVPAPAMPPVEPKPKPAVRDGVLRQVLPEIPSKARATIHGKATVVVKVAVNPSGTVTAATLDSGGSSYFGKLAVEAAKQWQFAPAEGAGQRDWTLRFEIMRTATHVIPQRIGRE